tara:strand:+ start:1779 stop:3617 length:1839 start_codon:yes stop_codon:yes gene_type:complete
MFLRNRYNYLASLFVLYFVFILYNLFSLQIINIEQSIQDIDKQTFDIVYLPAPRGEIYDKNDQKLVTTSLEPHLYINLRKINNENINQYKQYVKYNFKEFSNSDIEEIFSSKEILYLLKNINDLNYIERQALLELEAFEIFDYPIRKYLYENIASHILGYIGRPTAEEFQLYPETIKNGIVGKSGVEKSYEEKLSGTAGEITFKGSELIKYEPPIPGEDLYISIDIETQIVVTESLEQGIALANENFDSENIIQKGAVVVMDIDTGEIVSMVSVPDFNPNKFVKGISGFDFKQLNRIEAFNNFAIQGLYPPGSVFKVVAYWLAENEGLFPEGVESRDNRIKCEGKLSFSFIDGSQQVYNDWKEDGHGNVNLSSAIQQSCNVYFWDIALKIWRTYEGNPNESILQDYARDLGFGKLTEIDLPYEKAGIVPDRDLFEDWKISKPELVRPAGWLGGDLMNLIVGQGAITTTPIQVANAYKTLLTGYTSKPYLEKNIEVNSKSRNININEDFINFLLNDLNLVTNKNGTAYSAFEILGSKANDIGGKTGTAQNAGDKNNTSWFVGIDSISNPKFIIVTVVDEGGSGSAVAAPISRRVIQHLIDLELTPVKFGEITE